MKKTLLLSTFALALLLAPFAAQASPSAQNALGADDAVFLLDGVGDEAPVAMAKDKCKKCKCKTCHCKGKRCKKFKCKKCKCKKCDMGGKEKCKKCKCKKCKFKGDKYKCKKCKCGGC